MHRDDTLLSFNVVLNDERHFEGGGTCFATPVRVLRWRRGGESLLASSDAEAEEEREEVHTTLFQGSRGDCLAHCGQALHGGASVTLGVRIILVGFVSELVDGEWTSNESIAAKCNTLQGFLYD